MTSFLLHYGLVAIFLCSLLETDVSFILTGVAIHVGAAPAVPAVALMLLGALLHDTTWFIIGRRSSKYVRESKMYRKIGPSVERFADRFGAWQLFLCRFVWGTRNPSLLYWGVHHLAWPRYFAIEVASLSLWGLLLTGMGYLLSNQAQVLVGRVKSAEKWLLTALLVSLAIFLAGRFLSRRAIAKRERISPAS